VDVLANAMSTSDLAAHYRANSAQPRRVGRR
jgi:hypothetical protein